MNRIIWMEIGVAIGVIAFRKISTAQSALGPEGLNRAAGGWPTASSISRMPSVRAWASGKRNSVPRSASTLPLREASTPPS